MFGDSATAITILFILFAAGVAAFVRKRSRDKCLRDFERNMVTLEEKAGKTIWGTLRAENTGLEFVYPEKHKDQQGHDEASYILYKHEYPNMEAVIRFHDDLSEPHKKEREKELKRTYHPGPWRRFKRRVLNVFRTIRDSIVEIVNLLISQAKKATPAGKVLTSQDKYVDTGVLRRAKGIHGRVHRNHGRRLRRQGGPANQESGLGRTSQTRPHPTSGGIVSYCVVRNA